MTPLLTFSHKGTQHRLLQLPNVASLPIPFTTAAPSRAGAVLDSREQRPPLTGALRGYGGNEQIIQENSTAPHTFENYYFNYSYVILWHFSGVLLRCCCDAVRSRLRSGQVSE